MPHPTQRKRKSMARYGGDPRRRNIVKRGAGDVQEGREDTECRGEKPASEHCPAPGVAPKRH